MKTPSDAMSDRMKKKFPAYVPRTPRPGETPSATINLMTLPRYQPAAHNTQRVGLAVYQ